MPANSRLHALRPLSDKNLLSVGKVAGGNRIPDKVKLTVPIEGRYIDFEKSEVLRMIRLQIPSRKTELSTLKRVADY